MDAEQPEQAVDQDEADDAAERVRGVDQRGDGTLEEGNEVEAEEVDDDEDAAEDQSRGEEGDEAADDDLGGAAGEARASSAARRGRG